MNFINIENLYMLCDITVEGMPIALKRHRHAKMDDGKVMTFDPNSSDKKAFQWLAISKFKPIKPLDEPIFLDVLFGMKRPKSHFGTGKNEGVIKPNAPFFCDKKPDLDNLIKFVKDALNDIYWRDDSLIVHVTASKIYCNVPRTKIKIFLCKSS